MKISEKKYIKALTFIANHLAASTGKRCVDHHKNCEIANLEIKEVDNQIVIYGSVCASNSQYWEECSLVVEGMNCKYSCTCGKSKNSCRHIPALTHAAYLRVTGEDGGLDGKILEWMRDVDRLIKGKNKEEAKRADSKAEKKELTFVFNCSKYTDEKKLYMNPMLVKLKKNGEYSAAQPSVLDWLDVYSKHDHFARKHISDGDWRLLSSLSRFGSHNRREWEVVGGENCVDVLKEIVATERCYFKDIHTNPLAWGKRRKGSLEWQLLSDGSGQSISCVAKPEARIFEMQNGMFVYIDENTSEMGLLNFAETPETVETILQAPALGLEEAEAVKKYIQKKNPRLKKLKPKEVQILEVNEKPKPVFLIDIHENRGYWNKGFEHLGYLSFDYGDVNTRLLENRRYHNEGSYTQFVDDEERVVRIKRDISLEKKYHEALTKLGFYCKHYHNGRAYSNNRFCETPEEAAQAFMGDYLKKLEKAGFRVEFAPDFPNYEIVEDYDWFMETFADESSAKNDWFGMEMGIMYEGERINILPLLSKLYKNIGTDFDESQIEGFTMESIDKSKRFVIPAERVKKMLKAFELEFEAGDFDKEGRLHVSKWSTQLLEEIKLADKKTEMRTMGHDHLQTCAKKLKDIENIPKVKPSKHMESTLRPYQEEGLSWMQFLRKMELNGILADDMGLGKTIQVLAHLQKEKDAGRMQDPCLVIAPTSLMFNWRREIEKHTPTLKALVLHGADRHQYFDQIKKHDIVLTTYPLVVRDKEVLIDQHYHYLVLDEAQVIKNSRTQAYQVIQQIDASHRLCLTGTPMENHLGELWSLFNFLMPGFLGKQKTFSKVFRKPIEKGGDTDQQLRLAKRIGPFMMRRTKDLVAKDLPEKTEIIREIDFDSQQMDLYEMIRIRAHQKMMKEIAKKGIERSQIAVLEALLKLRQVCCDPRLVKGDQEIEGVPSAKLDCLMEMLPSLIEEGRRVLLFSQFTSMLSLIQEELDAKKIPYTLLTGSTTDRKTPVERFQNHEVPLMLLSLKAGGVGLNLTAADTVIHYDPWWNPAVESQATDRAHRIGQTNKVFVYKLVTAGTVEQKILAMQERKRELVSALLESKKSTGLALTMEDLEEVFKPLG